MANFNCSSCKDLKDIDPSLMVNGLGTTECTSLQNNTGLNPSDDNDDCHDLELMNDCFIGNMEAEVKAHDPCDWKGFMVKFIPNVWTALKGIICAICGLWKNSDKIWCYLKHLSEPQKNDVLRPDDPRVTYRAVDGVESRYDPQHPVASDAPLIIKAIGATAKVTGSLHFADAYMPASYTSGSGSRVKWLDFFRGSSAGNVRNQFDRSSYEGNCPSGGFLLYEYEVLPCDFGFEIGYDAPLLPSSAGDFLCRIQFTKDGEEYPYDCGWDLVDGKNKGQIFHASDAAKERILIQVRLMYVNTWGIAHENGNITPNGTIMVKPCTDSWDC